MFPRARYGLIDSRNYEARRVKYEISQKLDTFDLPEGETVILTGEYVLWDYLLIYENQWMEKDVFVYGSASGESPFYWTMRITEDTHEV